MSWDRAGEDSPEEPANKPEPPTNPIPGTRYMYFDTFGKWVSMGTSMKTKRKAVKQRRRNFITRKPEPQLKNKKEFFFRKPTSAALKAKEVRRKREEAELKAA